MDQKSLEKFSEELVKIRENKEITVEQISHSTRIDLKYIKAIEASDFDIMPEVYMRAFIKGYAKMLDLNGEEILKKFDAAKSGTLDSDLDSNVEKDTSEEKNKNYSEPVPKFDSPVLEDQDSNNRNKSNTGLIIGLILIFISLAVVVYFLFLRTSDTQIINETPFTQVLEEKSRFEIDDTEEVVEQPVVSDSLTLNISSKDTCWVKVLADQSKVIEFMLFPDRSKRIKALDQFNLVLGNGKSISFELDDSPIEFESRIGRIPNVVITRESITTLKEEINFPNE